eukprot:5204753-Prymnesium_polylepis.2
MSNDFWFEELTQRWSRDMLRRYAIARAAHSCGLGWRFRSSLYGLVAAEPQETRDRAAPAVQQTLRNWNRAQNPCLLNARIIQL